MPFSGDIYVLNKLAELSARFGVSPAVANFELKLRFDEDMGRPGSDDHFYSLEILDDDIPADDAAKIEKITSLLGFEEWNGRLEFRRLADVDKAVDHALSLAPRARSRPKS